MNSTGSSDRDHFSWLLGLLLALAIPAFLVGLGAAPIERAEIYFLDAARAMVERSDWLVPHYRGEPFYDKPPLAYWLLAGSFEAFGPSLFSGRLVAALLALATLGATYLAARVLTAPASFRSSDRAHAAAFYTTSILATSYAFVSFARLTMSDMSLTLLTLLAGVALLKNETESKPLALLACGIFLGFGFLAKGPIAWIYFGALLVAFSAVERRLPRIFNPAGFMGALAAVVLGLSWFVAIYLQEGIEPLKWFFLRENLQRFAATTYDTAQPFWYYFFVYGTEGLPWSILAVPAVQYAFRAGSPKVLRVLFLWSMLMLVPLSLSRGKLDYYLLPLLPPLSIVIGAYLAEGRPSSRTLRLLAVSAAILLVGALAFPMLPAPFAPSALALNCLRALLVLAALNCVGAAIRPVARVIVPVVAVSVLSVALFLFGAIVPAYRAAQPTGAFLDHIARERAFNPDLQVAVCDDTLRLQRDILFTLRIPVMENCQLWAVASSSRKFLIIVTPGQEQSLRTAPNVRHIATLDHLPADITRIGTLLEGPQVSQVGLLANFETTDPVARWKRNREFKRWLDTPEGQKWDAERIEADRLRDVALRRAGLK